MADVDDGSLLSDPKADEGLVVSDSDGMIVDATDLITRVTGYSKAELLAMPLSALFWTSDEVNSDEQVGTALCETDGSSYAVLECADGTRATVEQRSYTVRLGPQGYVCTTVLLPGDCEPTVQVPFSGGPTIPEADAFRRLQQTAMDGDSVRNTAERLLALGHEYLGADAGALARIEDSTYEVEYAADPAGVYEPGQSLPLEDTVVAEGMTDGTTDRRAFAVDEDMGQHGVSDSDVRRAYVGAAVFVGDDMYGVVEFTGPATREGAFGRQEREFVEHIAQLLGHELEQEYRAKQFERYSTILEAIDDPVYALDTDARFTFLNEAAKREFGYGEEIIGEHVSIGMDAVDIQRLTEQVQTLVETDERSKITQFEIETADGDRRLVENRFAAIGENSHEGTAGVLRDVTDREQRRQQLESFQQAIEEAADGVAILEDDEYVYVDQTHVDTYGFDSADQLLGNTWRMLYDDDEVARLESEAFPTLESEGYWRGNVTGSRPDGTTFPAELSLTIVGDGRLVCTFRDETERLARERELELKERAMDEADVGIQITDPTQHDHPLVYVNDGFERLTGYEREEMLGRNPRFLQGKDTDSEQVARLRQAIDAEESESLELRNYRKDGTPYWSRISITPVRDAGGTVTNYIGIQQDVTERRNRQRALQERQRKLDLVLSKTDVAITELDLGSGRIDIDGSPGDKINELPQTSEAFFEMLHPADRERLQSEIEGTVSSGDPLDTEYRIVTEAGETVWLSVQAAPATDGDGSPEQIVSIVTDISELKAHQEALEESQQRYQTLLEAAPDPMFVADAETGDILEVNAAAEETTGRSREDLLGVTQADLHPAENRDLYRAAFENASDDQELTTELPDGTQPKLYRADGDPLPVEINAKQIDLPEGRAIYGVFRDMTERHRQQQRTERFVEQADDVVTVLDTGGTITYASGSAERVLGYDPDDIVGENLFDYLHPDGRDHAMQTFRDCVDGADTVKAECRLASPDGGWFNIEGRCRNMLDDEAVDGILVYLRDVTDIKERERRFESIFNQTYQFTGLLEPDGTVIEANEAAFEFGGFDCTDIAGKSFAEAPWWTHSEDVANRMRDALERAAAGEFVRYETEARGEEGMGMIDFSVKPVTDEDGDVNMLVAEGRDITAQNRRRKHLQVMQRVLRHNIRNDLTKLRGFTEALYKLTDKPSRTEYFDRIQTILDKWADMTEKSRQIRQALENRQHLQTSTAADEIVDDAAAVADGTAVETTVTNDLPETATPKIPGLITEAVSELVGNAAQSMTGPDAQVTVTLSQGDGNWIDITVSDNGPGLPDEEASVLQTGEETSLTHGQGLGLWMVRMFTNQVGGNVSVDVTDDGTDVTLCVPTNDHLSTGK